MKLSGLFLVVLVCTVGVVVGQTLFFPQQDFLQPLPLVPVRTVPVPPVPIGGAGVVGSGAGLLGLGIGGVFALLLLFLMIIPGNIISNTIGNGNGNGGNGGNGSYTGGGNVPG